MLCEMCFLSLRTMKKDIWCAGLKRYRHMLAVGRRDIGGRSPTLELRYLSCLAMKTKFVLLCGGYRLLWFFPWLCSDEFREVGGHYCSCVSERLVPFGAAARRI